MAKWWDKGTKIPYTDQNFQKIIDFYLFNCPCETEKGTKENKTYTKVSQRATTFRSQGWTGGNINILIACMKKTSSGQLEYRHFKSSAKIEEEVIKIEKGSSLSDKSFEMIALIERSDMKLTSSIFYYIRNAFAHGSFSVINDKGKKTYFFESAKDTIIKAQIRLREDTLIKWIKDFRVSPKELQSALKDERRKKKKADKNKAA